METRPDPVQEQDRRTRARQVGHAAGRLCRRFARIAAIALYEVVAVLLLLVGLVAFPFMYVGNLLLWGLWGLVAAVVVCLVLGVSAATTLTTLGFASPISQYLLGFAIVGASYPAYYGSFLLLSLLGRFTRTPYVPRALDLDQIKFTPDDSSSDADNTTSPSAAHTANGSENSSSHQGGTRQPQHQSGDTTDESSEGGEARYVSEPPAMDFNDVAGMEDLKEELHNRIIDPIENSEKYDEYGISADNGFLLYGPPGTGKTHLAKALAGELGRNYVEAAGADISSRYINATAENVKELFAEARAHQPCLVFIDEIDALVPERGGTNQHEDQTATVNQFLDEVSRLDDDDVDVILVGATNRRDRIDDAMLRSGRLSEHIEVPPPDEEARMKVLFHHLEAPTTEGGFDRNRLKALSDGLTAADMERVAMEAARTALSRDDVVRQDDLETAIESVRNN